jgi:hypothetical protein
VVLVFSDGFAVFYFFAVVLGLPDFLDQLFFVFTRQTRILHVLLLKCLSYTLLQYKALPLLKRKDLAAAFFAVFFGKIDNNWRHSLIVLDVVSQNVKRNLLIATRNSDQVAVGLRHVVKTAHIDVIAVIGKVRDEDGDFKRVNEAQERVRYWQQIFGVVHNQQNALFKQQRCKHSDDVLSLHDFEQLLEVAMIGVRKLSDVWQVHSTALEVRATRGSFFRHWNLENYRENVVLECLMVKRRHAEHLVEQDFEDPVEVVIVVEARDDADGLLNVDLLLLAFLLDGSSLFFQVFNLFFQFFALGFCS